MGYDATALGAYMGVHLTIQLFMLVMQGSYVFSGKEDEMDLLLLKAESLARARWCYLTETDEEGADIYWWKFEEFFNDGLWRERTQICTPANYKAMSEEAYDCIVSCLGSSSASKILKGVPKGDGSKLLKKLHAAKGSVEHQIQRWDRKLDRLSLVAMNGWIDFRDEWLEAADGRNNIDELEEDDILAEKVLFRKFYKKLQDVFPLIFQSCHVFVTLLLVVQTV
jgi:hypothetical protein